MLTLLALGCLLAAPPTDEFHEFRRPVFGVEARIAMYGGDRGRAEAAARAAFARAEALDFSLSDWREDGELGRLARAAGGDGIDLSPALAQVLSVGLEVAEKSAGAFDPTAAPLTHLWRRARAEGQLPTAAAVGEAALLVGWEKLEFRPAAGAAPARARLRDPGMALDLGGVAKGYAAGELLAVLEEAGFPSALVELGGDLALGAAPPGRGGWRVRVGQRDLLLSDCAVATSGSSEQHLERDGQRWSHLVDPRSGSAVTHDRTATVIAPDGALADALASACGVLSPRAAEDLVASFPGARLIWQRADPKSLFDGVSLAGWTTSGGRYDGAARWSVEDGAIVGRAGPRGEGGLLYTEQVFSALELECEVRVDWPFDSGIFLHMLPSESGQRGLQVTLDHREGGQIGALYADEFLAENRSPKLAPEQWNHLRVRVSGFDPRVEVWLEDRKILDHTVRRAKLAPGATPFASHGRIGLQVHSVDPERAGDLAVSFRNLWVRELPIFGEDVGGGQRPLAAANGVLSLSRENRALGWLDLLEGGLAEWTAIGDRNGYEISGGVLRVPAAGSGHLATRGDFGDFALSAEFRLSEFANSGLFLRAARDDSNPAYSGAEIQLIDDLGWEHATGHALAPTQTTGSLYGALAAPHPKRLHPAGEWNRLEVLAEGARLAAALNGLVLFDVDTDALPAEPPFSARARRGWLGFQRYGAPAVTEDAALEVRNLFVRPTP